MGQQPMDFAVVLHNGHTDISLLIEVLTEKNIFVLNILTFSDWLALGEIPNQNVLLVRPNGDTVLAKDIATKEAIHLEIDCLTTLAFKPRLRTSKTDLRRTL
jgi:hypothetical protein